MTKEWKWKHQQQHDDIAAGYRHIWPPLVTERWESEFEAAVAQRGWEARKAFLEQEREPIND